MSVEVADMNDLEKAVVRMAERRDESTRVLQRALGYCQSMHWDGDGHADVLAKLAIAWAKYEEEDN